MSQSPNIPTAAWRALLDLCPDGICVVDQEQWRVVFANQTFVRWVGEPAGDWPGRSLVEWIPEIQSPELQEQILQLADGRTEEIVVASHLLAGSGEELAVDLRVRRVDSLGERLFAVAVRKATAAHSDDAAESQQRTDPLTGLADRAFLMYRLTRLLHGDRAGDQCCAVLFVDVDGFKQVNDTHGHLVGDRVLCEVARRLAACVRGDDHVARFGGDEFVVLLESVCGRDEIQPVVLRIRSAFDRPVALAQGDVTLTVSVGVAEASPGCGTADDLIDAADRSMYAAKRAAAVRSGL